MISSAITCARAMEKSAEHSWKTN